MGKNFGLKIKISLELSQFHPHVLPHTYYSLGDCRYRFTFFSFPENGSNWVSLLSETPKWLSLPSSPQSGGDISSEVTHSLTLSRVRARPTDEIKSEGRRQGVPPHSGLVSERRTDERPDQSALLKKEPHPHVAVFLAIGQEMCSQENKTDNRLREGRRQPGSGSTQPTLRL